MIAYNKKSKKLGICAIAVAALMLMAGVVVMINTDDSEAANLTPTVNVYYYDGGWDYSPQTTYDLYQAIDGAKSYFGYTITTTHGSWVSGYNPDMDYGKITKVNDSTSFAIYAYDNLSQQWEDITTSSIGWIRPFADYGAIVNVPNAPISASANVAIVTGTEDVDDITGMIDLCDVRGYDNTLYKFTLHDNVGISFSNAIVKTMVGGAWNNVFISASDIQGTNTFDVYGYGSDAYLALIDAVGANLVSDNMANNKIDAWVAHDVYDNDNVYQYTYYTYYSWMVSLFGVGTDSDFSNGSTYWYWMSSAPNVSYLSYNFGYYSQLTGAYNNVGGVFNYTYIVETYP